MMIFYPLTPVPWWEVAWAGLALLCLSVFLLHGARRYPYLAGLVLASMSGWMTQALILSPISLLPLRTTIKDC
ncbi:MAG: hypothetical protein ACOZFS_09815 [Thermodesulfobacteriota bacterium]